MKVLISIRYLEDLNQYLNIKRFKFSVKGKIFTKF